MIKPLRLSWLAIAGAIAIAVWGSRTDAQITPDGTLGEESSVVTPDVIQGKPSDRIDGGATRGANLFHSFLEFNVGEGRGAYFSNPNGVENIFSRVTGGSRSEILGALGVLGEANLFLINPNGILFGPDASLDVKGSFVGTTANGIGFGEQGFFSATNPEVPQLLRVNPSAFLYNQVPTGAIVNLSYGQDSTGEFVGLQVPSGENLTLLGGEVRFEAGEATARGGNVNIGGLGAAGTVILNDDGSLNFPEDVVRADISFSNAADVDVRGTGGGSIDINARNLSIEAGEFGSSRIRAGIAEDFTSPEAQAGNITINATDTVELIEGSRIENSVEAGATGNSGNIEVIADLLTLTNDASLDTRTSGVGNAGHIFLEAREINFSYSTIFTEVSSAGGIGDAGNINISTNSLLLQNGSSFLADTENKGDAGNILIEARDTVILEGTGEFPNQITATVDSGADIVARGDAGNIEINTGSLSITDGGFISTNTSGIGNGGSIFIIANESVFLDSSNIYSNVNSAGVGNSGGVEINTNSLSLENGAVIGSSVEEDATGNSGGIKITTGSLSLTNRAQLLSNTDGQGDAGSVNIFARNTVSLDNGNSGDTVIFNNVFSDATGNSGGINITTGSLSVNGGAQIQSEVRGEGNSGKIVINASDTVSFNGRDAKDFPSTASSGVEVGAKGNSGGIEISTDSLSLTNRAQLLSDTRGRGDAGNISIEAQNQVYLMDSDIISEVGEEGGVGEGGSISIKTGTLLVQDGSSLLADTENFGDAGNITIEARDRVVVEGEGRSAFANSTDMFPSQITATVDSNEFDARGEGGDITISTGSLLVADEGFINTSTEGLGNAGDINITAADSISVTTEGEITAETFSQRNAGNITIETNTLSVNDSKVSSTTFSTGNAGNLTVRASELVDLSGEISGEDGTSVSPGGLLAQVNQDTGKGRGGNLTIETGRLRVSNGSKVQAATFGEGDAGNLLIQASEIDIFDTSDADNRFSTGIFAGVLLDSRSEGIPRGDGGNLTIETDGLRIRNGGRVLADTEGIGNAGNIDIVARGEVLLDGQGSRVSSSVNVGAIGEGGDINITAESLSISNGAQISAESRGQGEAGNIIINAEGTLSAINGDILTAAERSSGGVINITAQDIRLQGDSDIRTNVASGADSGGNITLTADSILAFDDSDILAFARNGVGGDIQLETPVFFGSSFQPAPQGTDPDTLNGNERVDINASGGVASGAIDIPDVSFIQNSLTELSESTIDTETLIANSCVVPSSGQRGTFIITGAGGLPVRPGEASVSPYPTGTVRTVPDNESSLPSATRSWQKGVPIVEPTGTYRLANGKLVMSRECSQ